MKVSRSISAGRGAFSHAEAASVGRGRPRRPEVAMTEASDFVFSG